MHRSSAKCLRTQQEERCCIKVKYYGTKEKKKGKITPKTLPFEKKLMRPFFSLGETKSQLSGRKVSAMSMTALRTK